jgi:hypothetical protein
MNTGETTATGRTSRASTKAVSLSTQAEGGPITLVWQRPPTCQQVVSNDSTKDLAPHHGASFSRLAE